ncbi:hypothetical protein BTO12_04230 [Vibrio splendidus]|nr:hypothetical protein BTO12_04230 [Vibrio splendidus]
MNRDITVICTNLWKKSEWKRPFLFNLTFRENVGVIGISIRYKKAPHIGEANYYLLSIERELIETQ